jgi:hypothetical protein
MYLSDVIRRTGNYKNLPDPDVLAAEIIENLGAALAEFESISAELGRE